MTSGQLTTSSSRLMASMAISLGVLTSACGPPESVSPTSYSSPYIYGSYYVESPMPVSASLAGTLVTWWYHTDTNGLYNGYAALAFDLVVGDNIGIGSLFPPVPGSPVQGPPVMSAVADDGYILTAGDGFLRALDPVGHSWWSVPLGALATTSVAIASDGTTYVGDEGGVFYAFTSAGDPFWATGLGATPYGHPAIAQDGSIWFAARHLDGTWTLYGLESSGEVRTAFPLDVAVASPSIDQEGHVLIPVYGGDANDNPADPDLFMLSSFDMKDGLRWQAPTHGQAYAAVVGQDGTLYVAAQAWDEPGHLLALSPDDGAEVWRTDLEGDVWQPAVLDNGLLVVGCGAALCGYHLKSGKEAFAWPSSTSVTGVFGPPLAMDGVIVATTSYGFYAWEMGGRVNTETRSWARLGSDNALTGRAP